MEKIYLQDRNVFTIIYPDLSQTDQIMKFFSYPFNISYAQFSLGNSSIFDIWKIIKIIVQSYILQMVWDYMKSLQKVHGIVCYEKTMWI